MIFSVKKMYLNMPSEMATILSQQKCVLMIMFSVDWKVSIKANETYMVYLWVTIGQCIVLILNFTGQLIHKLKKNRDKFVSIGKWCTFYQIWREFSMSPLWNNVLQMAEIVTKDSFESISHCIHKVHQSYQTRQKGCIYIAKIVLILF